MTSVSAGPQRRDRFTYVGLTLDGDTVAATYQLDDVAFTEVVSFDDGGSWNDAARNLLNLWFLVAGLSYYKAGAPRLVDFATTPVGPASRAFFDAALRDGLAEYAVRNNLWLDDITVTGGVALTPAVASGDPRRVLTPFGGGIDSIVTVESLRASVEQTLFVVSPAGGRFAPLEEAAAVSGLPVARVTRTLDPAIRAANPSFFQGHVPVTAMVTLLAAVAAARTGRGGVAMSNEHSASMPNLEREGHPVNHQWSKSWVAEQLLAAAIDEQVGGSVTVASFLRDRSELWVAQQFAQHTGYHATFRSCNRAFTHDPARRAAHWCGECDKCLFINLVLAPFVSRASLRTIFGSEQLADPARQDQLATLVGIGLDHKPFDCVGDPDECATALAAVAVDPAYADVPWLAALAERAGADRTLTELLEPQGGNRVPPTWLS